MRGIFSNVNDINLFFMTFPRKSLHCKLVPVHYREYECDSWSIGLTRSECLKVKFCDSNQQNQFWRTQEIVNNNYDYPYIVYKIKQFSKWRATFHSTPKGQRLCFITVSFVSSSLMSKIRRVNLINPILHMHVSLYRVKSVTCREKKNYPCF